MVVFSPERLGRIFDNIKVVFPGNGIDAVIIGRQAEQIHRDHALRAK